MKNLLIISLIGLASLVQISCAQQSESQPELLSEPRLASQLRLTALEKINAMITFDCDTSAQCRTIGIDPSPCGGYARHLIYSEKSVQAKQLKTQVTQYNLSQKQLNKKKNLVGICVFISPPKTYCSSNRCVNGAGVTQ